MKGLWGKIIRVNLAGGSVKVEDVPEHIARSCPGGKALAAHYAIREIPKGVDPLGPENNLYLFTGVLTGTATPTGNRFVAATKSPLTGTFTDSYGGGYWGPELRFAGYDGMILEGISESPVRIHIQDDDIGILDASDIWGTDTWTATERIKNAYGTLKKPLKVLSIGQAGERQDVLSAIIADARAAARGGVGAVMGSKNLKAISIIGSKRPPVDDHKGMMALVKEQNMRLNKNPVTAESLRYRGTPNILMGVNEVGALPTRNFQDGQFEGAENISGESMRKVLWNGGKNWHPCWNCVIKCTHFTVLEQPGYEGKIDDGPEYETTALLGSCCGIDDPKAIALADYILDGYGMDTISVGNTIAFLMECYEKGIIGKDITNGLDLRFGNKDAWLAAIHAAGKSEGILGRLVANGTKKASEEIGKGTDKFAANVKGQEIPAYDPRCGQGTALSYARCERGADHLKPWVFNKEYLTSEERTDPFDTSDKPGLIKRENEASALLDCICVCRFVANELTLQNDFLMLVNAATGFDYSWPEFWEIGERAVNLVRSFTSREGFGRKDDSLPERFVKVPLSSGLAKGNVARVDEMLPKYYEICGWDSNGMPTKEKLRSLGLEFVIEELYGAAETAAAARAA
ncbi:aldehyde:ferredoxin oxidoreductase [Methanocella sp. CWC-04]|uniref:Aldehyde:ferredoxin oxidoreductase n=1 Tax=Methanooceanicella nereidis TaxID=2052831 RepID=A0AAP2REJ0_9EURY|nr:aldehyde ferredoxin oxidoreductase family protein [Methanocella sp. CWC-04]MCD1296176.1 aldehyde:ferredoxin oxidoreductase [Methanocella sp. CWC-04]